MHDLESSKNVDVSRNLELEMKESCGGFFRSMKENVAR